MYESYCEIVAESDCVVAIAGSSVRDLADFCGAGAEPGDHVTRTVDRQGQQREIGALKQSIVAAI
jgi:hypothetical protein